MGGVEWCVCVWGVGGGLERSAGGGAPEMEWHSLRFKACRGTDGKPLPQESGAAAQRTTQASGAEKRARQPAMKFVRWEVSYIV